MYICRTDYYFMFINKLGMRLLFISFLCFLFTVSISQELKEDGLFYFEGEIFTGSFIEKYDDGSVKTRFAIRNGKLHGKSEHYYPNGNLNEIRSFRNGLKHGKWSKYNENKTLVSTARYRRDLKHGKWKIWDDNGTLRYTLQYRNGEKTGTWKMFDENGNLVDSKTY